jgi:hypothetical protein
MGDWYVVLVRIKEHTSLRHMFDRNQTMSSNIDKHSTLNNEHNWDDLCIQFKNKQTCTSSFYDYIMGGLIFNLFLFFKFFFGGGDVSIYIC